MKRESHADNGVAKKDNHFEPECNFGKRTKENCIFFNYFAPKRLISQAQTIKIHFFLKKSTIFLRMSKKSSTFAPAFERKRRKDGRVVYCVGLENRSTERYRGFESLSFRKVNNICPHKGSVCYLLKKKRAFCTHGREFLSRTKCSNDYCVVTQCSNPSFQIARGYLVLTAGRMVV